MKQILIVEDDSFLNKMLDYNLTALGQKMREARKKKDLTQQELADLSHVSVKQIANIEKGKMNPSYLILKALAKVLPLSLDTLINPNVSPEDEGANQMKMLYRNMAQIRKLLLCQVFFLSGFPHFLP